MDSLNNIPSTGISLLIGAVIFLILFLAILEVLKKHSLFSGATLHILAVCVSLLSVIGIFRIFVEAEGPSDVSGKEDPFSFILLPYAAMGISILIILLIMFLRKTLGVRRERSERSAISDHRDIAIREQNAIEQEEIHSQPNSDEDRL